MRWLLPQLLLASLQVVNDYAIRTPLLLSFSFPSSPVHPRYHTPALYLSCSLIPYPFQPAAPMYLPDLSPAMRRSALAELHDAERARRDPPAAVFLALQMEALAVLTRAARARFLLDASLWCPRHRCAVSRCASSLRTCGTEPRREALRLVLRRAAVRRRPEQMLAGGIDVDVYAVPAEEGGGNDDLDEEVEHMEGAGGDRVGSGGGGGNEGERAGMARAADAFSAAYVKKARRAPVHGSVARMLSSSSDDLSLVAAAAVGDPSPRPLVQSSASAPVPTSSASSSSLSAAGAAAAAASGSIRGSLGYKTRVSAVRSLNTRLRLLLQPLPCATSDVLLAALLASGGFSRSH